ncbi:class I SAM-dependent methyltransferase, partial [uncultured Tessaracoccus sp.]|uniref:class I SAM-dependent methyltransferase n=1 Tax=uncultured Tessaracoccus sp. TaxID=905023 RepID=UPI0026298C32
MNAQRQPREGIRATLDKRRDDVASMFDNIAPRYDLLNGVLSLGQDRGWRRETIKAVEPRPRQLILDLAAGTGTSSQVLAESGATVVPADLSFGMLHQGRKQYPALSFINADALQLPFPDETFD